MELSKEETTKREKIIAKSDEAIAKLNDNSQKHEKLLKLFKSWQEEDSREESTNQQISSLG